MMLRKELFRHGGQSRLTKADHVAIVHHVPKQVRSHERQTELVVGSQFDFYANEFVV